MKLKCRKIRNVEKSVCTAEQKIAYNYAFSWYETGKNIVKADTFKYIKCKAMSEIERLVTEDILNKEEMKKYNIDAIIIAFRNGFWKYCKDFFIATNYEAIGKCFAIPYEVI